MLAWDIVRLDPPELERVSAFVWLPPTVVLPRFMLDGALRKPGVKPLPERVTVTLFECEVLWPPQEAEAVTVRVPLRLPAVWGTKETDKLTVCCGATVIGGLGPAKLNPVPETVA